MAKALVLAGVVLAAGALVVFAFNKSPPKGVHLPKPTPEVPHYHSNIAKFLKTTVQPIVNPIIGRALGPKAAGIEASIVNLLPAELIDNAINTVVDAVDAPKNYPSGTWLSAWDWPNARNLCASGEMEWRGGWKLPFVGTTVGRFAACK